MRVSEILKPGGAAFFFEPCENGMTLVKLAYDKLQMDSRFNTLEERVRSTIARHAKSIEFFSRNRANVRPELYKAKDDKWMFSRRFFQGAELAERYSRIVLEPTFSSRKPISNKIKSRFAILGLTLPPWVADIVEKFERELSVDFLHDNPMALSIILVR